LEKNLNLESFFYF